MTLQTSAGRFIGRGAAVSVAGSAPTIGASAVASGGSSTKPGISPGTGWICGWPTPLVGGAS